MFNKVCSVICFLIITNFVIAQETPLTVKAFSFNIATNLPGNQEQIFDLITGDISGWWDHSFSEKPDSLYLETFAGGGFFEILQDKSGTVKHAEIIYSERGKTIRFEGPLGLSGKAIQMVTTYDFSPNGTDSTKLNVTINGFGALPEGTDKIIESVWKHFIFERFTPFVNEKLGK